MCMHFYSYAQSYSLSRGSTPTPIKTSHSRTSEFNANRQSRANLFLQDSEESGSWLACFVAHPFSYFPNFRKSKVNDTIETWKFFSQIRCDKLDKDFFEFDNNFVIMRHNFRCSVLTPNILVLIVICYVAKNKNVKRRQIRGELRILHTSLKKSCTLLWHIAYTKELHSLVTEHAI